MTILLRLLSVLALSGLLLTPAARADDPPQVAYINLMPAIVGNYAAGANKLKVYKAEVALRINAANKDKVTFHEPLIRDQLVLLFAQKGEEDFASIEGKEAVRKEALQRIQMALQQEEGIPLVDDLLFNNLVVQN